jgi:hypothetical protein
MAVLRSKRWAASRGTINIKKKSRFRVSKEKEQKEIFSWVGRGGDKMATQAIPPPDEDSCQKQADLGQKRLLTCDVASHVTSEDSGQSHHFPANSSTSSFSKKPF